jgi:hypothetical protein
MLQRLLIALIISQSLCLGAAPFVAAPATGPAPPDNLISALRRMSPQELLATTLAGLRMRDAQLQNFSCELTSEVTYVDPRQNPPKRQLLYRHSTVEKRLGRRSFLHDREFAPDGAENFEYCMNWDGSVSFSLTLSQQGVKGTRGSVDDSEPINMVGLHYNRLLGYRVGGRPPPPPPAGGGPPRVWGGGGRAPPPPPRPAPPH